ncbi:DUF4429 domain-containing protein [Marinactinospora thermotolerans]|nr:DUF4429 domain-containing protein [Marinactinospora thermotolerans]
MDDLHGNQATWRFDGEKVLIRYRSGWRVAPLLKELGGCEVPLAAIASVDFTPKKGRRGSWDLRLRLRDHADPFAAVGAALSEKSLPFHLTGDASTELVAEYYADQLSFSVEATRDTGDPGPAERFAVGLVPPLPLHIRTSEGTAAFDGRTLLLAWSGDASSRKHKEQRREFPIEEIRRVEWAPGDGWNEGYLRVVTHGSSTAQPVKPSKDLHCLLTEDSARESARALLMAATVTAHLWAREEAVSARRGETAALEAGANALGAGGTPPSPQPLPADDVARGIYDRIRELGRLHEEGLLTDEEFRNKKAELLDRL